MSRPVEALGAAGDQPATAELPTGRMAADPTVAGGLEWLTVYHLGGRLSTMSRETKVTFNGTAYVIPEIWLAGFCTANRCSVQDAVAHWAWQAELEAMESADAVA